MHRSSVPGYAEPTGFVLKYTSLPPSWYQKQPFGTSGFEILPQYVFPLVAAAMLQASSVAIRENVAGHLLLLLLLGAQV